MTFMCLSSFTASDIICCSTPQTELLGLQLDSQLKYANSYIWLETITYTIPSTNGERNALGTYRFVFSLKFKLDICKATYGYPKFGLYYSYLLTVDSLTKTAPSWEESLFAIGLSLVGPSMSCPVFLVTPYIRPFISRTVVERKGLNLKRGRSL